MSNPGSDEWIAELDQMMKGVTDFVKVIRAYYLQAIESGFSEEQAMMLTVSYQRNVQTGNSE